MARLKKIAPLNAEVLICGPSGSGKELYAQLIHHHSHRSEKQLVPVNCAALGADLLENVMFGHVGGAFTGAKTRTEGLVQAAEGGTLFLDEVDNLTLTSQVKLLRFLQDRRYRRLGETQLRRADVRIVAACNSDLVRAIAKKRFRRDLFFRLRVCPVVVPPLVMRMEDLQDLLAWMVAQAAEEFDLPLITFSAAAMDRMRRYSWPGNVRELQNCVRYLTCLQKVGPVLPGDLPLLDWPDEDGEGGQGAETEASEADVGQPLKDVKRKAVDELERCYIEKALSNTCGNVSEAARRSGKARRAFFELMRKHKIDPTPFRPPARPNA